MAMWFGTIGNMRWVPHCDFNADFSSVGYSSGTEFLNGGASIRNSDASHMVYNMSWGPSKKRDALRPITDYASGKNGRGLIYFIDPMAADKNILPEHWAFPAQAAADAPVLIGPNRPTTARLVQTVSNPLDYPIESAKYALTGTARTLYLPIPPGHVLWFGAHGTADGWGGVQVRPHIAGTGYAAPVYPRLLSVTDPVRMNASYSSVDYQGIEISLAAGTGGPLAPSGDLYPSEILTPGIEQPATSVILSGMMAQVLPAGVTPETGDFISGQGHSGCEFRGKPQRTAYSAALDKVGMTAVLVETGSWL